MIQLTISAALAITVLWPLGIWICTRKYLKAFKEGKKTDAWIWFAAWCIIIAMVEWFALALYVLGERVFFGR